MTDREELERGLAELRKRQPRDWLLEFDGGTLIPKGAALLNDGRDHRLVSDADSEQTGDALPMPMRDTTTGQKLRVVQLGCEDEDDAAAIMRWVERVNA